MYETKTAEDAKKRIESARVGCFMEPKTLDYLGALSMHLKDWLWRIEVEITCSRRNMLRDAIIKDIRDGSSFPSGLKVLLDEHFSK
jgi:hypothetical protein